jgi:glycosyltransferase involved in cell wall biosynthesis
VKPGPRVSIIVPAYNSERFLPITLDSIVAQTFAEWELIVVDDGSTDGTQAVVERYAASDRRVRYVVKANGGVAAARNHGFGLTDAATEYVGFLDHDDLWEPDALARLTAALQADPAAVAAHGLARCIDEAGRHVGNDNQQAWMRARNEMRDGQLKPLRPEDPTTFAALAVDNWVITPGTMLIRRNALQRVGGFDPRTTPADDWDLNLRLSRLGDLVFVDHVVLSWRRFQGVLSETSANWRRAYFRVRDKAIADPANSPAQARIARMAYRQVNRGSWREAWSELRRWHFTDAARRAARALSGNARYLRGVVTTARR